MSNQQRARLPPTPSNSVIAQSNAVQRHPQNIDVQNNTISTVVTTTDSSQMYNNNNINDDSLNALGPDLAIQTSKVLENLSDHERTIILDVLSRDESIRQRDSARIMLLRAELHNLKKRSALKCQTGSLDRQVIIDSNRSCARCRSDLGRILNRGAPCRACKLRVCKGCREFTNRTDWLCIVCHKQIELQNATGEWMNTEIIHTPPRRSSITQPGYIPTAEIIKKSISRSWTISNPEDDQLQNGKNGFDTRIVHPNLHSHEPSSYPNLIRLNKSPYNSNMDFNNPDNYERTPPTQRRVLRQSTLPNPDSSLHSSCLKIPSPKQQMSPQYSPYHTDNENEPENEPSQVPIPSPGRYQIRRQSTLPCKPNDLHTSKFLSTSPNRSYSRSPDPSAVIDGNEHGSRYPPFVRQATFPSNNGGGPEYHQRQLPTSPNRLSINKSPDSGGENGGALSPRRFMRQATLPNPDQHMKLLPTSPPKKSPQFIKRSPEFQRQNTISNPEGMNTLSVHGPKFLPISPRQKQNFLFPQPTPAPRTFLSQQHFPTMTEEQPQASVQPPHPHSKMIKVRSHSNEEYSFNRTLPLLSQQEGRRLLPEIPNRARSPSRLVRQDHVKDESEKRSPISKTFAEAKQDMYSDNQIYESQYTNEYSELNSTFAEADETLYAADNNYESYQQQSHPEIDQSAQLQFIADQTNQFHYDSMKITHNIRSTEVYINDNSSEYFSPEDYIKQAQKNRNRRRKSRELPDLTISTDEESKKHKPENMRSVSEDASPKTIKILPRRSFSQPEKETQKKSDTPQLPSPKILSQKPNSPKKDEGVDNVDDAPKSEGPKKPVYRFPKMLEMRGDSKSFDAVVRQLIKNENKEDEDKSQSMDENIFSDKKENKTTLNEAEIQNAVEQAASLFKKVVVQRRKERHPVEDAEMTTTSAKRHYDEIFETEMKYPLDGDDYRLVFISSDSSEKEDDCDDTSSTTSSLAIMFDDCDWDYFEPSITKPTAASTGKTMFSNMSPFDSPHFYRRRLSSSPLDSPVFYRRGMSESPLSLRKFRESDTGTDEEILNFESSSATSSEGFLPKEYLKAWKKNHKCLTTKKSVCRCGKSTHYVAVPVPILVPIDTFRKWNNNDNNPDLLQLLNTSNQLLSYQHEHKNDVTNTSTLMDTAAAAATQYQQVMGEEKLPETAKDEEKEKKRQKIGDDVSITSNISFNSNATQSRRNSQSSSTQHDNECDKGQLSHRSALSRIKKSENNPTRVNNCTSSAAHFSETIKITNKHDTYVCERGSSNRSGVSAKPYTNSNLIKTASSCSSNALQSTSLSGAMISVGKLKIPESGSTDGGYLISENAFSSSDNEESCDDGDDTKTVQRSYDVAGAAQEENIISDVDTNSNSATSGSDMTDSEDTGIDENRRSKAKRFTKVFVVNKNPQMSETDSCSSSANAMPSTTEEDEDTSDNDTDTDGIKLNYMKPLESDNSDRDSVSEQEVTLNCIDASDNDDNISENNVILNSIKTIDDNDLIEVKQQHTDKDKENNTDIECVASEKKVNGTASENTRHDDKNKPNLPSNSDECANQMNVIDEIDEIVSNCDSLEPSCCNISNRHEENESIENFKIEFMDTTLNENGKKFGSCNLSMILGDGSYENNKSAQTNDVRTGSADNENLVKIESPLNPIQHKQEQKQQHNITESDSQTTVTNDSSVPVAIETGLYEHMQTLNVTETLLNDQHEAGNSNNNYNTTQQQESNLCAKQNVNEEIATQELLNVENTSVSRQRSNSADGNGKFTSLIMITQQDNNNFAMDTETQVSVTTTDTTKIITGGDSSSRDSIVVQHRNWQPRDLSSVKSKIGFYEENINKVKENLNIKVKSAPNSEKSMIKVEKSESENENDIENDKEISQKSENSDSGDVTVITGQKTLSAVICLEDGLADDDSWVEEMSQNDDEEFPSTETGSDFDSSDEMSLSYSGVDREEELRGYNRVSIDFTLHTIVEESCEESEYEQSDRKSQRISASELEKYFFFGLGEGGSNSHSNTNVVNNNLKMTTEDQDESPSETSSVCSEKSYSEGGLDSLNTADENANCGTLASSRLEKYFLTGFMGFQNDGNDNSDGSGSVGSDSEGRPSPEQRRKKLVRARGTGRSHSSSLDNLLAKEDSLENQSEQTHQQESNDSDSSATTCDDNTDKTEYHSDTVKRKKKIKKQDLDDTSKKAVPDVEIKNPSDGSGEEGEDGRKTPQPEFLMPASNNLVQSRKQHSRDSGFIGSNDDLLKSEKSDGQRSPEIRIELEEIQEEIKEPEISQSTPQQSTINLMRKDSFNAWSSDEETNLMMSKMRQFFKSLIAANANTKNSRSSTPIEVSSNGTPKTKHRQRPPQLVYFENELTRLMKTVPGIKDEQVKEFVEYFSSEDAWSDSYDSSDYTSSDKEPAVKKSSKIQQQISASCQEIIEKFDRNSKANKLDEEGDMGDGGVLEDGINKETAFVYQKLVASITKIADEKPTNNVTNSPPIIAKVMHHIGSRLVALMHEVSSGESMKSNSPKQLRHHRRLQAKISATTTEDDDSTSESNLEDSAIKNLPRSKSHDLLLDGSSGKPVQDHMTMEEREASDYERFSWRGSFESALLTNCDSRNKLSTLENSSSALSILAAKRRSAGDLLFSPKNLSREQLDRVRSCGSIGGDDHDLENSKLWESTQSQESSRKRAGIIEDDTDESSDNDHQRLTTARSTLPRSLQTSTIIASTTNSLPRLPTTSTNMQSSSGAMQKAQSVYQFLQNNVKSARYRAPGFNRPQQPPKRALSVPGVQQPFNRRDRRNKVQSLSIDDQSTSVTANSQVINNSKNNSKSVTPTHPSPSSTTEPWPSQSDEDIDRLVAMHQNRHNSLSSLGLRSDSMASVYSGAGEGRYGTVQVKGMVEFGMQYNYKQCALEIHVKQCKDLAAVDTKRNRSDPYVKVYLLPDKTKSGKRKTKVKKHTLNPVFDEVLRFYMSLSSLESRTLWLTVWHSDMFGRNDFLGEVMISLQNKVFDNPLPQWYQLEERSEPFEDVTTYRGDIIVGLKFIPGSDSGSSYSHGLSLRKFSIKSNSSSNSANNNGSSATSTCSKNTKGSLHVLVKEAKHLSAVKANGNCDAFCKSYLLPDKNRSSKQKTQVVKRTTNPQWNYTFVYEDVTLAELSERALELTIWDHDRLASNEFLGGVRFSLGTGKHYGKNVEWNDANGKELTLWQSMINRPNFWVEGCLALRSSLENRTGT